MTMQKWIVSGMIFLGNNLVSVNALAAEYSFKDLVMKDFAEMEKLIHATSGTAIIDDIEREPKVREAIQLVLSRPNTEGKRSVLLTGLQGQLPEPFYLLSIQKVAQAAIDDLKSESAPNIRKTTSYIILKNLLPEIKPRANDYKGTLELISSANIEISEDLKSYAAHEGIDVSDSLSLIAKDISENAKMKDKVAVASASSETTSLDSLE